MQLIRWIVFTTTLVFFTVSVRAEGFEFICGFATYEPNTLVESVNNFQFAVFAKYVDTTRPDNDDDPWLSRFQVLRSLNGQDLPNEIQSEIIIPGYNEKWIDNTALILFSCEPPVEEASDSASPSLKLEPTTLLKQSLLKELPSNSHRSAKISDSHVIPMSEECFQYVENSPRTAILPQRQLAHAVNYLDSDDPQIVQDVLLALERSSFEQVMTLSDYVPRERLIKLLSDDNISSERKAYTILLLGIAGDSRDSELILRVLESMRRHDESYTQTAYVGLLLVDRAYGLARLQEIARTNHNGAIDPALLSAIDFFRKTMPHWLDGAEVDSLMIDALNQPDCAPLAILTFADWEAWERLDHVHDRYVSQPHLQKGVSPEIISAINTAVIRYLIQCSHSASDVNHSSSLSRGKTARSYLEKLRKNNPLMVKELEDEYVKQHREQELQHLGDDFGFDFIIKEVTFEFFAP